MSHFNLTQYQELRRAGMPRDIAHAMASVEPAAPEVAPSGGGADAVMPAPEGSVEKIVIPEDQDVTVAADDLAAKINEVIDVLNLEP